MGDASHVAAILLLFGAATADAQITPPPNAAGAYQKLSPGHQGRAGAVRGADHADDDDDDEGRPQDDDPVAVGRALRGERERSEAAHARPDRRDEAERHGLGAGLPADARPGP